MEWIKSNSETVQNGHLQNITVGELKVNTIDIINFEADDIKCETLTATTSISGTLITTDQPNINSVAGSSDLTVGQGIRLGTSTSTTTGTIRNNAGTLQIYNGGWADVGSGGSSRKLHLILEKNVTQSIPNSTITNITWNTELFNNGFSWSGAVITIPETGIYSLAYDISYANNITGGRHSYIEYGTSRLAFSTFQDSGTGWTTTSASAIFGFNIGDTIRLRTIQNSGVSLNVPATTGDDAKMEFGIIKLSNE